MVRGGGDYSTEVIIFFIDKVTPLACFKFSKKLGAIEKPGDQ